MHYLLKLGTKVGYEIPVQTIRSICGSNPTKASEKMGKNNQCLYKKVCEGVEFPNARVVNFKKYFSELGKISGGKNLINKFVQLKKLKGIIG